MTQIIDCDIQNDTVYYLATTENRPGYRHLYRIKIVFNITVDNNILVSSSQPTCLSCFYNAIESGHHNDDSSSSEDDNDDGNNNHNNQHHQHHHETEDDESTDIIQMTASDGINGKHYNSSTMSSSVKWYNQVDEATSCLFNNVRLSHRYSYFIQECLGPNIPSTFIVNTITHSRVFTLDDGNYLREKLDPVAVPIIKKFSVVIKNDLEAQVKLYLPPMLDEEEDLAYPLILHT